MPLDDELIQSDELEGEVLGFAHESFETLVASGFLDLPPGDAGALPEDEE